MLEQQRCSHIYKVNDEPFLKMYKNYDKQCTRKVWEYDGNSLCIFHSVDVEKKKEAFYEAFEAEIQHVTIAEKIEFFLDLKSLVSAVRFCPYTS